MSNRGGARDGAGRPKAEETVMMRVPKGVHDTVKFLISDYKNHGLRPTGGIHLVFHPKTELPEPGRLVVVRYRDHRRSWYNWGTFSEMLIAILKVKPSQWHTREELTRSKELVVDWAYVPDDLPYAERLTNGGK